MSESITFRQAMDTRCGDCEAKAAAHRFTKSGKFYCTQLKNAKQWERKHLSPWTVPVSRLWKSDSLNAQPEVSAAILNGLTQSVAADTLEVAA